jgi:general secretion pathway protein D
VSPGSPAAVPPGAKAKDIKKLAKEAEKKGDFLSSYLLYSQVAGSSPRERDAWSRSMALRRRALSGADVLPQLVVNTAPSTQPRYVPENIGPDELAEIQRVRPPPELKINKPSERRKLDARGTSRTVWESLARTYGFEVIFDEESYRPLPDVRLQFDGLGFSDALTVIEHATDSFLVPVSEHIAMVARDTPQMRQQIENTVVVGIPLPAPVTAEEAQELARTVQQTFDLTKFSVDARLRLAVVRGPVNKVLQARLLFEQLMRYRPDIEVEVQILEANRTSQTDYGLRFPGLFPLNWIGSGGSAVTTLAKLGLSTNMVALGIAGAEAFAQFSSSSTKKISEAMLRATSGKDSQLHVGDKFPILTAGYFGGDTTGPNVYRPPPTFTFEDLGIVLKVTPIVHNGKEISVAIEAELKVLTGQALNGIPVIASRKITSQTRLKDGEWAVVSGLVTAAQARSISGPAGLSQLPGLGPLFRTHSNFKNDGEAIIAIRPRLLGIPPTALASLITSTGSETRPRVKLRDAEESQGALAVNDAPPEQVLNEAQSLIASADRPAELGLLDGQQNLPEARTGPQAQPDQVLARNEPGRTQNLLRSLVELLPRKAIRIEQTVARRAIQPVKLQVLAKVFHAEKALQRGVLHAVNAAKSHVMVDERQDAGAVVGAETQTAQNATGDALTHLDVAIKPDTTAGVDGRSEGVGLADVVQQGAPGERFAHLPILTLAETIEQTQSMLPDVALGMELGGLSNPFEPRDVEQLKAAPGTTGTSSNQDTRQLVADAFSRYALDAGRMSLDRSKSIALNIEPQPSRKPNRAQHAQVILGKARPRITHRANQASLQIRKAADVIDHFSSSRFTKERIYSEIAALRVVESAGMMRNSPGPAPVRILAFNPKGRHLDLGASLAMPFMDQNDTEVSANQLSMRKQAQHLGRKRVGSDVEVLRSKPQQLIAHATTHKKRLKPSQMQLSSDPKRQIFASRFHGIMRGF